MTVAVSIWIQNNTHIIIIFAITAVMTSAASKGVEGKIHITIVFAVIALVMRVVGFKTILT